MKPLLVAQPNGELAKPVVMLLAVLSFAICAAAYFVVSKALPREAPLVHAVLGLLQLCAGLGLLQLFTLALKIYQGGRVSVAPQPTGAKGEA